MSASLFIRVLPAVFAMRLLLADAGAAEPVRSLAEIRHQSVIQQKWDLSCGAAALATILNYQHGENLSERDIAISLMKREEYVLDPELVKQRQGFSLLDLKRASAAFGYRATGFGKLSFEEMLTKAPIIVPIHTMGYNHFVVVRGTYGNRILLADPAWGNRTMRVQDFLHDWIDYPGFGHVGLTVERTDGAVPPSELAASPADFPFLR